MNVLIVLMGVLIVWLVIRAVLYRQQIKSICRQLIFLRDHKTNKRIQTDLTRQEILLLTELINQIYDAQERKELCLQAKDRRMKEMLTNVSHDIRTPLTALKGYFQLLMTEEDPLQNSMYAKVMREKMDELTQLLDELFTYTKLQNEEYNLEIEACNITLLVLEVLFSFYEAFKQQGIAPVMEIDEQPAAVYCNDVAVKRVLSNIIKNALVHGNGNVYIQYTIQNQQICFICKNTVAVPENIDIHQIFDRFYRADPARGNNATGLGLAIAKDLVEKMGGSIEARLEGEQFTMIVIMNIVEQTKDEK